MPRRDGLPRRGVRRLASKVEQEETVATALRGGGGGDGLPWVPRREARRPSVGTAARGGLPRRGVRRRKVDSVVRAATANSERSRATREGSKYSTVQLNS